MLRRHNQTNGLASQMNEMPKMKIQKLVGSCRNKCEKVFYRGGGGISPLSVGDGGNESTVV